MCYFLLHCFTCLITATWCSSHRTRDHRWPCVQFNCSSNMEQFTKGSAVFRVAGHFATPPENWTVRAFLQLTPRLSNDFTAAWLTFTFPQLFVVAATLKSIDYNVSMTFILNNNNNNHVNEICSTNGDWFCFVFSFAMRLTYSRFSVSVYLCLLCNLGDATVGKSSITQVFHSDNSQFPKNYTMVRDACGITWL